MPCRATFTRSLAECFAASSRNTPFGHGGRILLLSCHCFFKLTTEFPNFTYEFEFHFYPVTVFSPNLVLIFLSLAMERGFQLFLFSIPFLQFFLIYPFRLPSSSIWPRKAASKCFLSASHPCSLSSFLITSSSCPPFPSSGHGGWTLCVRSLSISPLVQFYGHRGWPPLAPSQCFLLPTSLVW